MGFTLVLAKIAGLAGFFAKLAVLVFAAFWLLSTDAGCWVVEQVLSFAVELVGSVDASGLQQSLSSWGTLPAEVLNILGLLRVAEAAAIIVSAIGIRLVLQLVPATRLGS